MPYSDGYETSSSVSSLADNDSSPPARPHSIRSQIHPTRGSPPPSRKAHTASHHPSEIAFSLSTKSLERSKAGRTKEVTIPNFQSVYVAESSATKPEWHPFGSLNRALKTTTNSIASKIMKFVDEPSDSGDNGEEILGSGSSRHGHSHGGNHTRGPVSSRHHSREGGTRRRRRRRTREEQAVYDGQNAKSHVENRETIDRAPEELRFVEIKEDHPRRRR